MNKQQIFKVAALADKLRDTPLDNLEVAIETVSTTRRSPFKGILTGQRRLFFEIYNRKKVMKIWFFTNRFSKREIDLLKDFFRRYGIKLMKESRFKLVWELEI
ncbi:MAG TPA: hypothetical protein PKZ92_03775 [Candidatus Woesebacteria bacterium]|jgi:hypothetical protein|nr:hypothetical protein [Candidatus Shapirobacteria bacterium]HOR02347.1 hypothetical protein [Candidatus Woesebacteria bacterium]